MEYKLTWSILKQLSIKKKLGFTFQDVVKEFPERNREYLSRVLTSMVRKGMLYKVAHDIYHIIPLSADPECYIPDCHQVAKYFMQSKDYYIGYCTALEFHGIGRMNSEAVEYVVTTRQVKPAIRRIGAHTIHFIQHDESRFYGFENKAINPEEEVLVSDLEKTIVDIATRPQLCGGIHVLGKALHQAKDLINHDRLLFYLVGIRKKSAMKRLLFLIELLALEWTEDHERMMEELGTGLTLLDPSAPDQGRLWKRFGLKLNVDPIDIKTHALL